MCSNYPGIKLEPALGTYVDISGQNWTCHHMLTSSTHLKNRSFHVVERTRTSSKCQKMKNASAKRAKIMFFIVKYANLWGFCSPRRRGCLSSQFKEDDGLGRSTYGRTSLQLTSNDCLSITPRWFISASLNDSCAKTLTRNVRLKSSNWKTVRSNCIWIQSFWVSLGPDCWYLLSKQDI